MYKRQVFGYPSDNTLKPDAFIPRVLTIADYSTIVDVRVSFGGRAYLTAHLNWLSLIS